MLVCLSPPKEVETNSNAMGVGLSRRKRTKDGFMKDKTILFFKNNVIILSLKPSLSSLAPNLDPIYVVDLAAK